MNRLHLAVLPAIAGKPSVSAAAALDRNNDLAGLHLQAEMRDGFADDAFRFFDDWRHCMHSWFPPMSTF